MFVKYERSLKKLLKYYKKTNNRTMILSQFSIPRYKIDYLSAKGFLDIVPYVNEETNCRITISNKGIVYFDEKREKLFCFLLPITISVISLIKSFDEELVLLWKQLAQLLK